MSLNNIKNKEDILNTVYKWTENDATAVHAIYKINVYKLMKLALEYIPDEWISDCLDNANCIIFPLYISYYEPSIELTLYYGKYQIAIRFCDMNVTLYIDDINSTNKNYVFVGNYNKVYDNGFSDGLNKIICGNYRISRNELNGY